MNYFRLSQEGDATPKYRAITRTWRPRDKLHKHRAFLPSHMKRVSPDSEWTKVVNIRALRSSKYRHWWMKVIWIRHVNSQVLQPRVKASLSPGCVQARNESTALRQVLGSHLAAPRFAAEDVFVSEIAVVFIASTLTSLWVVFLLCSVISHLTISFRSSLWALLCLLRWIKVYPKASANVNLTMTNDWPAASSIWRVQRNPKQILSRKLQRRLTTKLENWTSRQSPETETSKRKCWQTWKQYQPGARRKSPENPIKTPCWMWLTTQRTLKVMTRHLAMFSPQSRHILVVRRHTDWWYSNSPWCRKHIWTSRPSNSLYRK